MMEVQKYLIESGAAGLAQLKLDFGIEHRLYVDRVVLNYSQIDSPKFHSLSGECRGLILRLGTWAVIARSFDRFWNFKEGDGWKTFPFERCRVETKLDGSLISVAHDGDGWICSTRSMAFAEGTTSLGITFSQLFWESVPSDFRLWLDQNGEKGCTYVFELTAPANRVVTPYLDKKATLIGARKANGNEFAFSELDTLAKAMGVDRPKAYSFSSVDEMVSFVNNQPWKFEGCVLVAENENGSHRRLKVKNPAYLAVANMRNNGVLSARRVLEMVMRGEHEEYLSYFECDRKYVLAALGALNKGIQETEKVWDECKNIQDRKTFAITMLGKLGKSSPVSGILFNMKDGKFPSVRAGFMACDAKKLAQAWGLKDVLLEAE